MSDEPGPVLYSFALYEYRQKYYIREKRGIQTETEVYTKKATGEILPKSYIIKHTVR